MRACRARRPWRGWRCGKSRFGSEIWKQGMSGAADTLTQDRQRLELSALSAPAVLFTVAMIAFPLLYTIWLSFQSFSSTGRQSFAGLANYARLIADNEFWHGLWVTIALYLLSLVA